MTDITVCVSENFKICDGRDNRIFKKNKSI